MIHTYIQDSAHTSSQVMPLVTQRWVTSHAGMTQSIGMSMGQQAQPGDVVACCGPLGAGKTTFVQGFAKGLGIGGDDYVRSPTFALLHEYRGRLPLFHFDFYRLSSSDEVWDLGFEEYLDAAGVVVVEWADKFPWLLPLAHLDLTLQVASAEGRYVFCTVYERSHMRYLHLAGGDKESLR